MRILVLGLVPLVLAGCIASPSAPPAGVEPASVEVPADLGELFTFDWSGRVLTSRAEDFSHMRPTEDLLWQAQQVGFLLDLHEPPAAMEVALDWEGGGEWMIMLHSHKADGTNTYVEHVTEMDAEKPKCLRVPPADLTPGHWQVMVHTSGDTNNVPFTLTVRTWGAEGKVIEDDRHGHWPQDGRFEVDEHDVLPCEAAA